MQLCYHTEMLQCECFAMQICCNAEILKYKYMDTLYWSYVTMSICLQCGHVTVRICYNADMLQCENVTMLICYNAEMFQCSNILVQICYNVQFEFLVPICYNAQIL